MLVVKDYFDHKFNFNTYVALGSFDGLHVGHLKLINKAIELSKKNKAKSMILTFKNHPLSIINKKLMPKLIMDNDYKIKLFEELGIDIVNLVEFDEKIMHIAPEDYIKNIIMVNNVRGLIVGFNHRFGYKNLGDIELLKKLSVKYKFELYIIDAVKINGEVVSSTKIREYISKGEIVKADRMLTRPYKLSGKVVYGKQNGIKMGFPTANIDYNKNFVIPKAGVYYTKVEYENRFYKGITNIGYNPTFNSDNKLSIETHILNFNDNLYGKNISLYFLERIRDDHKFDSIHELKIQIQKDKRYAQTKKL